MFLYAFSSFIRLFCPLLLLPLLSRCSYIVFFFCFNWSLFTLLKRLLTKSWVFFKSNRRWHVNHSTKMLEPGIIIFQMLVCMGGLRRLHFLHRHFSSSNPPWHRWVFTIPRSSLSHPLIKELHSSINSSDEFSQLTSVFPAISWF